MRSRRGALAPVGSYPAGRSAEGVEDLIGNAWEWTSTPYRKYSDPATTPAGEHYVIRGGAANSLDQIANAVFRTPAQTSAPRSDLAYTGFRCAMPVRAAK
jgi:iron(II)-dependent oxidoreductase